MSCSEIQRIKFGRSFDLQNPEEREALHKKMAEMKDGCQSVTGAGARLAGEVICEILEQGFPLARMLTEQNRRSRTGFQICGRSRD